jgi:diketogulonate reductase-like aldo/keto reductase
MLSLSIRSIFRNKVIYLYQLHASDLHTPMEETLAFLDDAERSGKIHYIGLSKFTGWQLQLFVSTAKAMGVRPPVTLQPQYSLLSREIEKPEDCSAWLILLPTRRRRYRRECASGTMGQSPPATPLQLPLATA